MLNTAVPGFFVNALLSQLSIKEVLKKNGKYFMYLNLLLNHFQKQRCAFCLILISEYLKELTNEY